MTQLTADGRKRLREVVSGDSKGSYFAANVMLLLDQGYDVPFVTKATFSTPEEINRIQQLFESGGIAAITTYESSQHA